MSLSKKKHSKETDFHAPLGIRTRNSSERAAAGPRLRPCDHWYRPLLADKLVIPWPAVKSNQTDASSFKQGRKDVAVNTGFKTAHIQNIETCSLKSILYLNLFSKRQGCTNFPKRKETPQYTRHQKGHKKTP